MSIEKVWVGIIPEINGGYGVNVIAKSKEEAMSLLREEYNNLQRISCYPIEVKTFDKAMEYFGGEVKEIALNKVYYDGFKE